VSFEVLTAVKMSMLVFRVLMPCERIDTFQRFEDSEDGGSMFLWNVGFYLHVHTALLPRRTTSISYEVKTSVFWVVAACCVVEVYIIEKYL
jgi:hypothetical protein